MGTDNAFVAVIPARFGSSRLPGKPLLDLAGEPMVAHVWHRACESAASRVVVATDDARIRDAMLPLGAEVVMTRADHPSGTDRLAEVAEHLGLADDAVLVNVQGDEPLIPPRLIDQVARRLHDDPGASIATLAEPIADVETLFNPNVVKVVRALSGRALYFSRAPIPWDREAFAARPECLGTDAWLRHIGLYAYRAAFLAEYRDWSPSALERLEQLEQLRALHHGHAIQVALAAEPNPAGVDTLEDLERVRALLSTRK
ncbi:3-deoxy-manno-octulosonate cytidylyltransferase [Halomonas sp. MCCC 1A17488]|uniref:3-deoxy-manno-octulosonate cytidylyltransferase n=1 Tax=Billgrantia sulfidoxydans TaxID=2733484 RepID=A0ABX7W6B8_9GAMM|nr:MULTISPECIES: 3-deoxy-manno-octulosonate cytidylyltransferase [Halomonas]MCE8015675.1 3-deoxy-manno-octulosonate cytidylyltransferase [Halomonas sp. MCCC 1A17488]MCG3239008.1 3-deoxy-manno-octulosonate cytidylyltransferase [Halomonas sp. MCCC 1A17488]QPP51041.1 3-deoxy-manno-octulosonate cytidylyltransferase [Halomonas sp. SS10-MC5]QTP54553.1 3-deoxy-manno-octulosonate cytidylyltransferase [Halomonas sulfidoxydans]